MFLNHFLHIFNKKSNKTNASERESKPLDVPTTTATTTVPSSPTPPPIIEEEENTVKNETPRTSFVSNSKTTTTLPEVEFEQSRSLLQLDFFSDNDSREEVPVTRFPKFEYLLQSNSQVKAEDVTNHDNTIKKRKLSTTLRHRLSHYRPTNHKSMKRTVSTPDLSHK